MKRIFTKIAVVAASAALCLSIAACGSSDSTSSAPTASAANDATASVPVVSAPATTEATASAAASSAVSQTLSGTYALDVDDAYLSPVPTHSTARQSLLQLTALLCSTPMTLPTTHFL